MMQILEPRIAGVKSRKTGYVDRVVTVSNAYASLLFAFKLFSASIRSMSLVNNKFHFISINTGIDLQNK